MSKLSSVQIGEIIGAGVLGCALLIIGGLRLSNPDSKDERRKAKKARNVSAAFKANESRFTLDNEYENPKSESDAEYAYNKGQKMHTQDYFDNDRAKGLTHKRKSKKTHAKGKQSKRRK